MSNLAQKLNRLALAVKRLFTELSHKVDIVDFNPLWKGVHIPIALEGTGKSC